MVKESGLYAYKATVEKIVDADTVDFNVDLGFNIYSKIRVRLLGVNAPERGTTAGKAATDWLTGYLPAGHQVTIDVFKSREKYGRWLAHISYNGTNVNEELIKNGHAIRYDGGKNVER